MTQRDDPAGGAGARGDGCPAGIAIAAGAALVIGGALVAAMFPPAPAPRLAVLAVLVGASAALMGNGPGALAVAVLAWGIGNGFLVNRYGTLSWHGRLDVGFVLGLLLAVGVGMAVGQAREEWRAWRRMRPFDDLLRGAPVPPAWPEPTPPDAAEAPNAVEPDERVERVDARTTEPKEEES